MTHRVLVGSLLVAGLVSVSSANAVTMSREILRCDAMESRVDKLECFEALADIVANSRVVSVPIEVLEEPMTSRDRRKQDERVHEFGLEDVPQDNTIEASIAGVREMSHGEFELTLDNEQVWRELEASRRATYAPGQRITIERTFLGSFRMRVSESGFVTRVKRIK